jgi:UDP-GlcNAc:undecaprenyl-phosphate GlcNAc-1-phosphate transferase
MFITIALIPIFRGQAVRVHAVDIPNARKVHQQPIPTIGGLAMAVGVLVPVLVWFSSDRFVQAILIGGGVLVFIGFLDDLNNLGYKTKFASQLIAACVVVFYGKVTINCLGSLLPGDTVLPLWCGAPLTILAIVGVTNAINLSDGLDGLAGGISMLSFLCIGFLAFQVDNMVIAVTAMAMVGAIFGFLRFNTHPATIFMGDAGSQLIGFLAVCLALHLTQSDTPLSPLLPLLIIGFPVLDTITVMSERIIAGKSPFLPDKNHFHHKLMRLDLYHTEAVLTIYIIQALMISAAYLFRYYGDWFMLCVYLVFSGIVVGTILLLDKIGWKLHRTELDLFKDRLRIVKEKNYPIRVSYFLLKVGLPALLLFSCFVPATIPKPLSLFTAGFSLIIIMVWLFNKNLKKITLELCLFLVIPFVIFFSETDTVPWMDNNFWYLYTILFGIIVLFMFLTLKFTRRKKGFKASPMDFLILFIAIVIPNLPDLQIKALHLGMIATKTIILFFGFEILIGDLRDQWKWLGYPTLIALLILTYRGLGHIGETVAVLAAMVG